MAFVQNACASFGLAIITMSTFFTCELVCSRSFFYVVVEVLAAFSHARTSGWAPVGLRWVGRVARGRRLKAVKRMPEDFQMARHLYVTTRPSRWVT